MKVHCFFLFFILTVYSGLSAKPSVSPMLYFIKNTEKQALLKRAGTGSFYPVTVKFDTAPTAHEIARYEHHGLVFKRFQGKLLHSKHIYPAILQPDSLYFFENSPDIIRIESTFRPTITQTLDVSNPQVQASHVWNFELDKNTVDGTGVTIANIDTGIDIFHPGFFKPDAGTFDWLDTNDSGLFEPGIDCVDINKNGVSDSDEKLNFYDAVFSDPLKLMERSDGVYDADIDWLYHDINNNGSREYGPDTGFAESDPSFGELLFIISDTNNNNRLDSGEKLTGLGTSKIRAIIDENGVHIRGENLFSHTGDYSNHGTGSSGIVGGQVRGRRLTGMAPGVEFICINHHETEIEESVLIAKELGADIFMYEFGNWMFEFLDGSTNLETFISDLHTEGFPQITASGNLAGPERKKHSAFTLQQRTQESIRFTVPQSSIKKVYVSILWQGVFITPSIILRNSTNEALVIRGDQKLHPIGDLQVISGLDKSPKNTSRMDIIISSESSFDGEFSFDIKNTNRFSPLDIDAYIADDVTHWMRGAQFRDFLTDDGTVCSPGTAEHDITTGAYDPRGTRNQKGAINDFSSWGKTTDGRRAVDITAPGTLVYSLSSHYRTGKQPGDYIDFGGTSSSLPHVVGCAALIKQLVPDISSNTLSEILLNYAQTDDFTGDVPNDIWGYGKLRIYDSVTFSHLVTVAVEETRPQQFSVSPSYPNPFNSTVNFDITASQSGQCTVTVFNLAGQSVSSHTIHVDSKRPVNFRWNGTGSNHEFLSSGLYFFRFVLNKTSISRKALFIK